MSTRYDMLEGIKEGGTFLLNSPWTPQEMEEKLPGLHEAHDRAQRSSSSTTSTPSRSRPRLGLGGRINMIMQAAFFKLANVIPVEQAIAQLKDEVRKKSTARRARRSSR